MSPPILLHFTSTPNLFFMDAKVFPTYDQKSRVPLEL